jgi:hypothetical protein
VLHLEKTTIVVVHVNKTKAKVMLFLFEKLADVDELES